MEADNNDEQIVIAKASDAELMLFLYAGNESEISLAQREFYGRFYAYLLRLARRLWGTRFHPKSDPEDMAAACLVKIFDLAEQYDPEKGGVKAWIGKVLKRMIESEFRDAMKSELPIQGSIDDPDFTLLEEDILGEEDRPDDQRPFRMRLETALGELKELDRQVLLEFYDSKDISNLNARGDANVTVEIAKRFGLTPDNVRQKALRSLRKLKQYLDSG